MQSGSIAQSGLEGEFEGFLDAFGGGRQVLILILSAASSA
jgi:hypothetical protein